MSPTSRWMCCAIVSCSRTRPCPRTCPSMSCCAALCVAYLPQRRPSTPMSGSARTPEALLRRLEWTVLRRLDGLLQGDYRSLFRGSGIDLANLREYQEGDDVRYIDWNVTARLQKPHLREYQEDRELTAWFLLDLSGSVDFGSDAVSK